MKKFSRERSGVLDPAGRPRPTGRYAQVLLPRKSFSHYPLRILVFFAIIVIRLIQEKKGLS